MEYIKHTRQEVSKSIFSFPGIIIIIFSRPPTIGNIIEVLYYILNRHRHLQWISFFP